MQSEASQYRHARETSGSDEILEAVGALRDYVQKMNAQVTALLEERRRLNDELQHLRRQGSATHWESQGRRVSRDLEDIARLYETASRTHAGVRSERRESRRPEGAASDDVAWRRKLLMLLVMSELNGDTGSRP